MLVSAVGALSDRLDSRFLTAYWVPAFVALLCSLGILSVLVGAEQMSAWVHDLDSVEQTLVAVIVILTVTMAAFILRALSRPVAALFVGDALPSAVAAWSTHGQRKTRNRMAPLPHHQGNDPLGTGATASPEASRQWLKRAFPLDDNHMRPTLLGNILETAVEYPRITYTMEGLIWWPRLAPLVPGSFQDMLGAAQAPMMGLLNLSIVFAGAAGVGGPMLILVGGHWLAAVITIVGGFLLARLCYRAATSQAMEVTNLVKVGFDLYRHDILRQMDIEVPIDLADERKLWERISPQMLGLPVGCQKDKGGESTNGDDVRPESA